MKHLKNRCNLILIGAKIHEVNTYIFANKLYKTVDDCLYKSKHNGIN